MKQSILLVVSLLSLAFAGNLNAEETVGEKIETTANKAGDSIKKGYRSAKDKTCEMVNGKMECVAKKLKHKVQNATDSMGTKATETKNEVTK